MSRNQPTSSSLSVFSTDRADIGRKHDLPEPRDRRRLRKPHCAIRTRAGGAKPPG